MSHKKRMFQVLDEMNVHDAEHSTQFVTLHNSICELKHVKQGTKVTIGVPDGVININDQMGNNPKKRIVLMVIDMEQYEKFYNTISEPSNSAI